MKKITLLFTLLFCAIGFAQQFNFKQGTSISINELDADQAGTDEAEFLELLTVNSNQSLDGLYIAFFNGSNDTSYEILDLNGLTSDSDGFFMIGNIVADPSSVDVAISSIQNGADAVAIYAGTVPTENFLATSDNLVAALVYGSNDDDDTDLLAALGESIQYNDSNDESIQRASDGSYCTGAPTFRAENIDCDATCPLSVFVMSVVCDAVTDGVDTYTTTLGFSGGGTATYTVTATEGTISGDDPSAIADGTIIVSGVNEGVDFDYTVAGGNCDITNTINAETCAPASNVNTIAELRAGVVGQEYTLIGEGVLTFQQDFRNQKFIEDQTAAILIDDVNGNITSTYAIGDGISGISGFLGEFNGMMQFSVTTDSGAATSSGNNITPQTVTAAELIANPNDYESEFVELEIFNIDTSVNQEWVSGTEYLMLENGSGDEYTFRTSFFDADYIGTQVVPEGFVAGIITERDNGSYYITARSLNDFSSLAGIAENNIDGFTVSPNPASSQITFSTVASGTLNVAIYDVAGKQVMNIENAQGTINVSELATGLYVIKATENGQTSIAKLVIK